MSFPRVLGDSKSRYVLSVASMHLKNEDLLTLDIYQYYIKPCWGSSSYFLIDKLLV